MRHILLSDLVDEFETSMKANAYSKNTVRNHIHGARRLLAHVGNIQVQNLTARHVDSYFAARQAKGLTAGSLNAELAALRAMFKYAVQRRYLQAGHEPTAHRRPFRQVRRDRLRVPASRFDDLLDGLEHPRDRIVVALGLYLFLRKSEVQALRVGDVNLDTAEVSVEVLKTKQFDVMPISVEMDRELRRWLTYYASRLGRPLRPTDYLAPAKASPRFVKGLGPQENARLAATWPSTLDPTRPVADPERATQRALAAVGFDLRDDSGKSLREGAHTLRRSGARALFDQLVADGYDGAMRTVQSMLHHSSVTTTEGYLGIQLDKKRRDDIVRGRQMFPKDEQNVVRMEAVRGRA